MKKIYILVFLLSNFVLAEDDLSANKYMFDQNNDEKKDAKVILEYPELKKFLFGVPENTFWIGVGASPLGLMGSKYLITLSPLQLHWKSKWLDWEVLNFEVGKTFTSAEFASSWSFMIRTAPKVKLFNLSENLSVSIGVLFGLEVIQYPEIKVTLESPPVGTPPEPVATNRPLKLSSYSTVMGGVLSQSIKMDNGKIFQISQVFYNQKYNAEENADGWKFRVDPDCCANALKTPLLENIIANTVMKIEFSYLY